MIRKILPLLGLILVLSWFYHDSNFILVLGLILISLIDDGILFKEREIFGYHYAKDKGKEGEYLIEFSLKSFLDKEQYHQIPNVTLPTADRGTTQIDLIIVSIYGVFAIEIKNYDGWIFGNDKDRIWTQKLHRYTKKFQNPLRQNYKHVKILESLLRLTEQQAHSVIVFTEDSEFKTDMPENVTHGGRGCANYIKTKRRPVLTDSEVKEIIEKIETIRFERSSKTDYEHVKYLKSMSERKESDGMPNCPRCGGSMILRESTKNSNIGKRFWGCEKYPRCKAIINIK